MSVTGRGGTVRGRYALRVLTAGDAAVISPIHVQVWRDTYAGLMPGPVLDGLDVERTASRWRDWLSGDDPPRVLGAFDPANGALAGWICVGAARDEGAPATTELWVLNVESGHRGTGLAHELMHRELADGPAYLWVVEGNERAVAFYRKHGFELDGHVRVQEDEGARDLRMVRAGS